MSVELKKRITTSFFLLFLLILMYFYTFILIVSLIVIGIITWIEFYAIISKIFIKKNFRNIFFRFICKSASLLYLSMLIFMILIIESKAPELKIFIFYSLLVSITSDIGGLVFGKIFKGKKLTKISPKKTISGSIGSFAFSFLLIPMFIEFFNNQSFVILFFITFIISFISQVGDLFISYLKRKAKVKDTGDILPGHGGILDRIDGMLFAVPIGIFALNFFY